MLLGPPASLPNLRPEISMRNRICISFTILKARQPRMRAGNVVMCLLESCLPGVLASSPL